MAMLKITRGDVIYWGSYRDDYYNISHHIPHQILLLHIIVRSTVVRILCGHYGLHGYLTIHPNHGTKCMSLSPTKYHGFLRFLGLL